jgi:CoA-transferase family III
VHARNKRCVTLDLRRPEGQEIFLALVDTADVVVESFRPGTLERWGLGFDVALSESCLAMLESTIPDYSRTKLVRARGRGGDLMPDVDLREVGLRDGLQLEEPIPTAAKLEILDAVVAAGVRRVEVTSFVSPKAVPALAGAADVVAGLGACPDVHFSALVAGPGEPSRPGCRTSST